MRSLFSPAVFSCRRVGGLTFIRIGRLSLSWCIVRKSRSDEIRSSGTESSLG
jgi:hypothetical protein